MTKDSYDGEGHACTVAESVTNENLWWEFIVFQQCKCAEQEWNHNSQREHMVLNVTVGLCGANILLEIDFNYIEDHDEAPNNKTLPNFDAINTSVNINSVRAENSDIAHINMIK